MILYSKPNSTPHYSLHLPELGHDYWLPIEEVKEAKTIPTSVNAKAGVFRQITEFDDTSIVKAYPVILPKSKTAYLLAMKASGQKEFRINTGTAIFDVTVEFVPVPAGSQKASGTIRFRVQARV
jgi:hypothetical protein